MGNKSASSSWQKVDGGESDLFKIAELDERANGGSDLIENTPFYIILQHDPGIKVLRIESSMGQVQPNPVSKTYTITADSSFHFNVDNQQYTFQYIPDKGSVKGLWFLEPPAKNFNDSGTPPRTIIESQRVMNVDIENFNNGRPVPFKPEYKATFDQYEFIPSKTDLVTKENVYDIGITFYYEEIKAD